jgi:hypothetical protein
MDIELQPIQNQLWKLYDKGKATKIGFGGPRGGTKSHSADSLMIMRRLKYRGTNGLFIMRVYQDMLDIHIRPMFDAYPELEAGFNKQDMILKLPYGSYIRFLSGENLESFQKRKGRGFADVMIDQSELFSKEEIEFLYTINRSVKPGITPKMLLCFNPGNIGHAYHKRVFYDKIYEDNEVPEDFAYLQAKGWDNAYWAIKDMARIKGLEPGGLDGQQILKLIHEYHKLNEDTRFKIFIRTDYGKVLDGLPDSKRRAELLGDMEIFEGMFFEDFRRKYHVIEYEISNFRKASIGGLDYGNVTVLIVLQRDSEGTIIAGGECYLPDLTNPTERANAIADYLLENELHRLDIVYDTDMEISQLSNIGVDKTPITIFRDVFKQRMGEKAPKMRCVNKTSLDKKKHYRVVVNDAVKEYLHIRKLCSQCKMMLRKDEDKCIRCKATVIYQTKLFISENCKFLIKFLGEAIYDPLDTAGRDFDRSQTPKKDHPYDAMKYGFMELYVPKKPKEDSRPKWLRDLIKARNLEMSQDFMEA